MQDSKLIELLRTLTTRQRTRFAEYVHSPFFNKHEQVKLLCDYLLRLAPDFDEEKKMEKERIYQALYPGKALDEDVLHSIFSKLLHLLYDYLVQVQVEAQPRKNQLLLLQDLRQRKLSKHYLSAQRKYQALPPAEGHSERLWESYCYHRELDKHFIAQSSPVYDEHLQHKSDELDAFYVVEKLRMACDMLSRNIVINAQYQCRMIDQVLLHLSAQPQRYAELPAVQIYRLILQTLKQPEQELFYQQLIGLIQAHQGEFSQEELNSLYDYALNYCVRKINEGNIRYYEEAFLLYEALLAARLIWVDGFLPPWEYKNIVTAALRTGRYAWAERFIEEYREQLPPEHRKNAYTYNLANLYYSKQDYAQALQALHEVVFTDTTYHLGAKIIQLKSYYELDEREPFQSLMDAFSMYLHRNKHISDYRKTANFNFLRLAKKLYKLKEEQLYTKRAKFLERLQQFELELQQYSPVANKDWVLEQCKKLADGAV